MILRYVRDCYMFTLIMGHTCPKTAGFTPNNNDNNNNNNMFWEELFTSKSIQTIGVLKD